MADWRGGTIKARRNKAAEDCRAPKRIAVFEPRWGAGVLAGVCGRGLLSFQMAREGLEGVPGAP